MVSSRVKEAAADEFIDQVASGLSVAVQPRTVFDVIVNDQVVTTVDRGRLDAAARWPDGFEKMRDRDKDFRDAFTAAVLDDAINALNDADAERDDDYSDEDAETLMRLRRVADVVKRLQIQLFKTIRPVIDQFDDPHDK